MKKTLATLTGALALVAGLASGAVAQGLQTGVVTGTITSNDGLSMPGATITVESPALQGTLSAVSDINGIYVVRGLPPGEYVITIEMDGMATAKRPTRVPLGRTVEVDVTMAPAAVAEQVTVRAEAAPVVTSPTIGANFNKTLIDPPCGVPSSLGWITPSSMTPAFNQRLIRLIRRRSPTRCSTNRSSHSCDRLPNDRAS